jgi:hypothetical protein
MKNIITYIGCLAAVVLATGCASGPKYSELCKTFPPLSPEQGRIFVYRPGTFSGSAVQPEVQLNGQGIGSSQPGGFFYVDRPAGQYELSTTTEVKRSLSLLLDTNQTRFVRLGISMGFFVGHVYPELVEPDKAEKEIQGCSYTGTNPSKP